MEHRGQHSGPSEHFVAGEQRVVEDPPAGDQESKSQAVARLKELGHRGDAEPPQSRHEDQRTARRDHVACPGDEKHRHTAAPPYAAAAGPTR